MAKCRNVSNVVLFIYLCCWHGSELWPEVVAEAMARSDKMAAVKRSEDKRGTILTKNRWQCSSHSFYLLLLLLFIGFCCILLVYVCC